MKIQWLLETEIDFFDLLGLIKISDSSGSSIEENCIYLDSMFSALAEGLVNLQSNEECEINLINEPAKVATFKELNQNIQTLCRIQF